jgi:hypothetical protein
MFVTHFNSSFLTSASDTSHSVCDIRNPFGSFSHYQYGDITSIELSSTSVGAVLSKLDISKSEGPDMIPPILLVNCADELSIPLNILFKRSITEGYLPSIWKKAFISPVHKKGPKNDVTNYRPISKLCIIAKVLEKIIYEQLYSAIGTFLPSSQHGFLKGRSTVTNLVLLNDFITESMEEGSQVDVVYTDYSKAFDRIDHLLLISKLQLAGIRGDLLRWFASYIGNRSQAVVLGNYISDWMCVPSGVPQGSLLGPLLFLIFVSDINTCFRGSSLLSFADDMKVFKSVKNVEDAIALQEDLLRLDNYCKLNKLDLNVNKCSVISFSRKIQNLVTYNYSLKGQVLRRVSEMRDLGVIHDTKLIFDNHIASIVNRASKSLGFIMRSCKDFNDTKTIKILYSTYVRCHLEYASQVWNPYYSVYIERLEQVQRKFIRFINFKSRYNENDYLKSCAHHHFLPLKCRRDISDILLLQKILTSAINCPELLSKIYLYAPTRTYRNSPLLYLPVTIKNYRLNSFIFRSCQTFNFLCKDKNLDIDLFFTSLPSLKKRLSDEFFLSQRHS